MKIKKIILICTICMVPFSMLSCGLNFQDDYILEVKENTDEKPSGDKVDEIFESDKISELMDKLKTTPAEISDKLDEVDSETKDKIDELNEKMDELKDTIDSADIEGKSEDIIDKIDE